ncbi:hypothetical protein [Breoghania sp.]|uniref:hypothetical protein n=1 Tax=Breoghania sp. TaxID=2065378 RepID=UPI00262F215F|nr:hypothetical protein [Breoghania sp.]MDJ0932953.1 hypothetical protein [Breoghania sp.]
MDDLAEQADARALPNAQTLLACGVAHDFNNLLLVMMFYADTLERHGELAAMRDEIAGIRHAVERGRRLTRQLQTIAGHDPVPVETTDPDEVLTSIQPRLRQALGTRGCLEVRMSTPLPPVSGDRKRLEGILVLLAEEARARIGTGGAFSVTAENAVSWNGGPASSRDHVRIRLEDDGPAPSP